MAIRVPKERRISMPSGIDQVESLKKLISSSTLGAKNILYEGGETNERVEYQRRDFNIPRA